MQETTEYYQPPRMPVTYNSAYPMSNRVSRMSLSSVSVFAGQPMRTGSWKCSAFAKQNGPKSY